MSKRLWWIFGPVICAGLIVLGLLLIPFHFSTVKSNTLATAAVSLKKNVLVGERMKDEAVRRDYVPFMGSSELSRLDSFHPSVLAQKYHRPYHTLLLGAPGTQSLVQYADNQSLFKQLRGRKVVFIISPQWFTPQGQRPDAFAYYYSPLQTTRWVLGKRGGIADRYAARRLLQMGNTKDSVHEALLHVASGQPVKGVLRTRLQVSLQILQNEEGLFGRYTSSKNQEKINRSAAKLPYEADQKQLYTLAGNMGAQATNGNEFGIRNRFFDSRLGGDKLSDMKGAQKNLDYRQSPEYSDLQLLLTAFAKNHVQVQFVIPPVNQKWATYTGLRQDMLHQTVAKIKIQLNQQGFDHVLDLSQDGNQPYFMEDTIHLGWRGWLKVDQTVKPFIEHQQATPQYRLNNQYFTKNWQQKLVP